MLVLNCNIHVIMYDKGTIVLHGGRMCKLAILM